MCVLGEGGGGRGKGEGGVGGGVRGSWVAATNLVAVQWLKVRLSVQMHTLMRLSRKRGKGWTSSEMSGCVCRLEVRHTYHGTQASTDPPEK